MGRSNGGRDFCKDFNRGECIRGMSCRFSHDFKPAIPTRADTGAAASAPAGAPSQPLGNAGTVATFDRFGRELCGDFKRGDCRRGDRCRYSHGDHPPGFPGPMMGRPPMMMHMGMMGMPPPMGMPPMGMPPMGMPPPGMMHGRPGLPPIADASRAASMAQGNAPEQPPAKKWQPIDMDDL